MTDTPRRRGRPNRAAASAKAMADIDYKSVDPLDVLRQVAADPSAPASARVAAARALHTAAVEAALREANNSALDIY